MDRMRALEALVAVADAGSFAAAARALSTSPPTVTRLVAMLENSLDATLLQRTTRAVTLTQTGHAVVTRARTILDTYADATALAKGAHQSPSGTLRLTAPVLFGRMYLSPVLMTFLDRFPHVKAQALYTDRVVNLVEEQVDVGVRIGRLPDSSYMAIRVGHVHSEICASPAYLAQNGTPHQPDDLFNHQLIALRLANSKPTWQIKDDKRLAVEPRVEFSSVRAAINAAENGFGICRALSYQVAPAIEAGRLVPLLTNHRPERMPIHLLHAEGRLASAKIRTFVDMAAEALRQDPALRFVEQP